MVGDVQRLRPHVKTHKSPAVAQLMMDAGIHQFKCATIAEAEMLALLKTKDVLLAYQPTGPKLTRFIQLIKKYPATTFSCLIDNKKCADEQSVAFSKNELVVRVYMDLNVGMDRTGIAPGELAIELYQYCSTKQGIKIIGLHAYDGHIRNQDIGKRKIECDTAFTPVTDMQKKLTDAGHATPLIIAGGSHTFPIHCKRDTIECSPGTFVYWDRSDSIYCPEQNFLPAILLVSRVVSLPATNKLCIDLGHKSVAAENEIDKRVFFLNAPELNAISQSEEHLVVEAQAGHSYQPGDILYGIPYHVCPTVALYERAITIEDGEISGEWKNAARDRKLTV
jgi:D-serine deaminase-like pyridoxal phosphate-dependent protein